MKLTHVVFLVALFTAPQFTEASVRDRAFSELRHLSQSYEVKLKEHLETLLEKCGNSELDKRREAFQDIQDFMQMISQDKWTEFKKILGEEAYFDGFSVEKGRSVIEFPYAEFLTLSEVPSRSFNLLLTCQYRAKLPFLDKKHEQWFSEIEDRIKYHQEIVRKNNVEFKERHRVAIANVMREYRLREPGQRAFEVPLYLARTFFADFTKAEKEIDDGIFDQSREEAIEVYRLLFDFLEYHFIAWSSDEVTPHRDEIVWTRGVLEKLVKKYFDSRYLDRPNFYIKRVLDLDSSDLKVIDISDQAVASWIRREIDSSQLSNTFSYLRNLSPLPLLFHSMKEPSLRVDVFAALDRKEVGLDGSDWSAMQVAIPDFIKALSLSSGAITESVKYFKMARIITPQADKVTQESIQFLIDAMRALSSDERDRLVYLLFNYFKTAEQRDDSVAFKIALLLFKEGFDLQIDLLGHLVQLAPAPIRKEIVTHVSAFEKDESGKWIVFWVPFLFEEDQTLWKPATHYLKGLSAGNQGKVYDSLDLYYSEKTGVESKLRFSKALSLVINQSHGVRKYLAYLSVRDGREQREFIEDLISKNVDLFEPSVIEVYERSFRQAASFRVRLRVLSKLIEWYPRDSATGRVALKGMLDPIPGVRDLAFSIHQFIEERLEQHLMDVSELLRETTDPKILQWILQVLHQYVFSKTHEDYVHLFKFPKKLAEVLIIQLPNLDEKKRALLLEILFYLPKQVVQVESYLWKGFQPAEITDPRQKLQSFYLVTRIVDWRTKNQEEVSRLFFFVNKSLEDQDLSVHVKEFLKNCPSDFLDKYLEQHLVALDSNQASERLVAAQKLTIVPPTSEGGLRKIFELYLNDSSAEVRKVARAILFEVMSADVLRKNHSFLKERYAEETSWRRRKKIVELEQRGITPDKGDIGFAVLVANDPHPSLRQLVKEEIDQASGTDLFPYLLDILPMLESNQEDVRFQAVSLYSRFTEWGKENDQVSRVLKGLVEASRDSSERVRKLARVILDRFEGDHYQSNYAELKNAFLLETDQSMRALYFRLLCQGLNSYSKEQVRFVIDALDDSEVLVREEARASIVRSQTKKVAETLFEKLEAKETSLEEAEALLQIIGGVRTKILATKHLDLLLDIALGFERNELREAAQQALESLVSKEDSATLREVVLEKVRKETSWRVRRNLLGLLGRVEKFSAQELEAIASFLEDPIPSNREHLIKMLDRGEWSDYAKVVNRLHILAKGSRYEDIRLASVHLLGKYYSAQATRQYYEALGSVSVPQSE